MLPFFADLPPQIQERVVCSISAAVKYEVPVNIVLAVAEKEGGKPSQWVRNSNGTYDIGPMQFNTSYLHDLAQYGITANDVAAVGCYPFDLAAWRLRGHILHDEGDLWTRAANYHSRSYKYNFVYRADLIHKASRWADWLETHFITIDVTRKNVIPLIPDSASKTLQEITQEATAIQDRSATTQPATKQSSRSVKLGDYVPRTITFRSPKADQ